MILVTGATGTAGSHVVRALIQRGAEVRVLARDADVARRLFADDVEVAVGDFAAPETLRAALDGVSRLFVSCSDDPRRVAWETGAIDAAADAGVERVVKLSSIGAAPGARPAFWDWHGQVEEHLRRALVRWVVLRPGPYMSNVLAAADAVALEGVLPVPAGGARIATVDPRDVGAAAAAVLLGSGHDGRAYTLTGPAAITYDTVAAELSAVLDRDVRYRALPDAVAREAMVHAGLPEPVAEQVVAVYAELRRGAAADVSPDVESLTGRPPRAFAAWANDHVSLFATEAPA